jgi:hypothetical protein
MYVSLGRDEERSDGLISLRTSHIILDLPSTFEVASIIEIELLKKGIT